MSYKIEKDFIYEGYRCVITARDEGHRCGYVGIPKGHPLYKKSYDDLWHLEAHTGLTYCDYSYRNYPLKSKLWWLGFHCATSYDGKDFELIKELGGDLKYKEAVLEEEKFPFFKNRPVRTAEYVEKELISLVKQIKEMKDMSIHGN